LLYRRHYKQISFDKRTEQSFFADQIRINQLSFFGIEPTVYERDLHLKFIKSIRGDKVDEKEIDLWRNRLLESNRKTRYYSQHKLQDFLLKLQHK
jgi:hypothetical protein